MKANRLILLAVASTSVLALTGCAPSGNVAAFISGQGEVVVIGDANNNRVNIEQNGFGDIVVEADLGIHDFLAVVPVLEGAGGVVTDWQGQPLTIASGGEVVACGDRRIHEQALRMLG